MTIFVIIGTITLPGIKIDSSSSDSSNTFFGIINTIGGGGLRRFSLVSLGISPYITASLIMTFAQTKLCPPIYRLYQSGPAGRVKINYITYGLTFVFALIQGIVIIQSVLNPQNQYLQISIIDTFNNVWFVWIVLPFILIAGTFFSMFIAELITNKGVGNGSSMLILAGSIISLPTLFTSGWSLWIQNKYGEMLFRGIVYFIGFIILFIAMIFIISFMYQAERKVPIQHTGVGRSKSIKDLSYLPIKLNPAGIMPIIFASMLITFPMLIVNLININYPSSGTRWMMQYFQLTNPLGLTIFASATFCLTVFLSLQQSKIDKIVEDFNKSSTFIPGIRPGEQTEDYLYSIVLRLSLFSAVYLTILGSMQYVAMMCVDSTYQSVIISATSLMIITTVSIETVQQIEARRKIQNIFKTNTNSELIKNNNFNSDEIASNEPENNSLLW